MNNQYQSAPGMGTYHRKHSIPESDRCTACEGMGVERVRYSMTGQDWRECFVCNGTGREPEWRKELNKQRG